MSQTKHTHTHTRKNQQKYPRTNNWCRTGGTFFLYVSNIQMVFEIINLTISVCTQNTEIFRLKSNNKPMHVMKNCKIWWKKSKTITNRDGLHVYFFHFNFHVDHIVIQNPKKLFCWHQQHIFKGYIWKQMIPNVYSVPENKIWTTDIIQPQDLF